MPMPVPDEISRLVERFNAHREAYRSGQYKETQLRVEFVDPFFKALGWDVHNENGYAEAYKDVVHEDALKIGGATEAPDACFRIGGVRKFFVECKKPSVNIKDAVHPAYQLRRYGWSAKLPVSVLTDFEEFAVYDCRVRPTKTDSASVGRVMYVTCDEYATRWDEMAGIFSRESVLKGSFDAFAAGTSGKKGTATVDDAFLAEIERWRDLLARGIALRNPVLSQRELNFAVQRTIDRIVFLRICEDRGIEPYGRLQSLLNGARVYPRLCEYFCRADERYNSGLFHFEADKDRPETPDELTLSLTVDDSTIQDIVANLYYPDSPYEFSVLSADILGQVYERFLGKVIRLTAGHQAKIEEKPEVRKAGGVVYTPDYITQHIVRETVGPLLEGRTPRQAVRLRILDMSCGSGSFALAVYQYLLDWHRDYYVKDGPEKHVKVLYRAGNDWRLTTEERKRILLNNVYGVDIDAQAVEVTKLSLLLKVLEGESQQTLARQYELFHQRALPDLGGNIKCGNSLVSPGAAGETQLTLLPEADTYRINAFDWHGAFPQVFGADDGGFDAIVGNPPYVRIQVMKEWAPIEVELYKSLYRTAAAGNYDLYTVFVEKALRLLNGSGRLGYILPHKFFNAQYGAALRGLIAGGRYLSQVVHFGDQQVFEGVTTYTCLLFLEKAGVDVCRVVKVHDLAAWREETLRRFPVVAVATSERTASGVLRVCEPASAAFYPDQRRKATGRPTEVGEVPAARVTTAEWNFTIGPGAKIVERLAHEFPALGLVADIFVGLQTSADDVFIMDAASESSKTIKLRSKSLDRDWVFEKALMHPLVSGRDISGFAPLPERQFILFPYEVLEEQATLIPFADLEVRFPKTAEYLQENKTRLAGRERGKFKGQEWHRFGRSQNLGIQSRHKVCVPRLVDELCAAYDGEGTHFLDNVDVGGLTFKREFEDHNLRYLVALLNSRVLRWFFPHISAPFRGGWYSANRQFLSQVPFRPIDFARPDEKATHDLIVRLVDHTMALKRQFTVAKSPHDKDALERQIYVAARQLDDIVDGLYGVSGEALR